MVIIVVCYWCQTFSVFLCVSCTMLAPVCANSKSGKCSWIFLFCSNAMCGRQQFGYIHRIAYCPFGQDDWASRTIRLTWRLCNYIILILSKLLQLTASAMIHAIRLLCFVSYARFYYYLFVGYFGGLFWWLDVEQMADDVHCAICSPDAYVEQR